jgi:hypothetical protein
MSRNVVAFVFYMATEYRNNANVNVVTPPMVRALPYSTLPLPALQSPVALPIFSRSSAVGSRSIELTD